MPNIADPSICEWSPAPYLFFSDNIWGNFIYYSHLFPSLTALLIASFVLWHNPRGKANIALFFMSFSFTLWSLFDLILWASERSDLIMFFWSILIYFELFVYIGALYFIYAFITGGYPSWKSKLCIFLLLIPLFLFGHTSLNLLGFDFTNCWREAFEGPLWLYYIYNIELLLTAWILVFAISQFRKVHDAVRRKEIILATLGVLLFLLSFSFGNIFGSLEVDWELGQYGLFGMPVFVAFLTYLIVRFQTFNAKIISTEALVVGLGILITSLMFVRKIENVQVIAMATLVLTTILGVLLIRSVRKEVEQRKEIEELAVRLKKANKRLRELDQMKSEFVSIASHQLRSPLTSIRGYASMLLEGSFGKITKKMKDPLERIHESSRYMALSIEDFLNVSRIESGKMKYEYSEFNLKDMAEKVADETRSVALKKGLLLVFRSDCDSGCMVNADVGKVRQVLHNLIDNSIKYTPKGTINVIAHDDVKKKKMYVSINDTGIGMKKGELDTIFDKFVRAKNANSVNVTGSGLGLFVAKQMIEEMKGKIIVKSDGPDKGSTFTIELPLSGK